MTILFTIIFSVSGLMLFVTLVNVFAGPRLERPGGVSGPVREKVSLLIPARNEACNIASCLDSVRMLKPGPDEILVLDDNSSDETADIVRRYAGEDIRIRLIKGDPLPEGWLGKNWACRQLADAASGEILAFTDADNTHAPDLLEKSLRWMRRHNLDMLSAFPQQILEHPAEKAAVPVVDMFVYSMLPLWLTRYTPQASLAAANGQWIVFRREAYEKLGGHTSVRNQVVEDVELSRRAKRAGLHIMTLPGTGAVYGRMYQDAGSVREGFTKNLYGLTGFNPFIFTVLFSLLILSMVGPYLLLFFFPGPASAAVALNMLIRLLLSSAYRHPLLMSVLLHPLTILYTASIALRSAVAFRRGTVTWKGRNLSIRN